MGAGFGKCLGQGKDKNGEQQQSLILFDNENEEPFTRDTFLAAFADLHIGEWRRRYTTQRFGYTVCDGTQWELEFEYNNGHKPVRFDGDNAYPYNFKKTNYEKSSTF